MDEDREKPLTVFVSFPSLYTQSLINKALVSTLPNLSLSPGPFPEDSTPTLQWADYDLLSFTLPHSHPTQYLTSSYIYRKALIRKHQLHLTVSEYLAKVRHRGLTSVLEGGGVPRGWVVELQFADELDELMRDELWELGEDLEANLAMESETRQWFILKPGFADRAQGIRMFSTEDELRAIFRSFEPPSEAEDAENEDHDVIHHEDFGNTLDSALDSLALKAAEMGFDGEIEAEDRDDGGTGVMTSQLRHFVIHEYMPRPILFDIAQNAEQASDKLTGHKFHLRAYALITGGYTVHLSRTVLALFSGSPYIPPSASSEGGEIDLRPHLTNTCLQTDAYGAPTPPEELVKLFWELEGLTAVQSTITGGFEDAGRVDREWLDMTFAKVGEVVGDSVKAGAECGSFGLQLVPNAFEIFGVDLLLSFSETSPVRPQLPIPTVTLLEYNASPDFHQSGDRLRPQLLKMFKGLIRISILPFFGITVSESGTADEETVEGNWELGQERWGWRLVGRGEVRGPGGR